VAQLDVNAHGEVLEPGRVADCYLGLLLPPGPAGELEAGTVLIVAPAALLHPRVPQPAASGTSGPCGGYRGRGTPLPRTLPGRGLRRASRLA